MSLLASLREVQIPLLAAMLLGACGTRLVHVLRAGSVGEAFGPTAHFPAYLRRPAAVALCLVELSLGAGLVLTAGPIGEGPPATSIRLASCLFFVVATCALVELRASRPEVGCGCFGNLSTAPVGARTIARSALLALAGLATIGLPAIGRPAVVSAIQLVALLVVEMLLIGALSPEIGEGLIRLGYSEPCELRDVPAQRTLAALRRSRPWRRYSPLITSDAPADVWRELCWRYVVYPSAHDGMPADLVFAIYLQQRRPAIRVALVDSVTGQTLPWPASPTARGRVRPRYARASWPAVGAATTPTAPVRTDMPLSTDVYAER
ncbi:MAG: MauE/DoxX family redox-associated membrane protein [Streptosporangiaceae bacterium]